MATFKCKMCGGSIEVADGQNVVTCEFCGTSQTVHTFDSEKKNTYFKRANALRYRCEFDKASGIYETIVSEFPNEAEAYWGLVLCKYGIEYVDDPKTGEKIPTCHRTQFASIFDDPDYKNVIKNAGVLAKDIYKKEANAIANLQKGILEISSKEEPFDIFICYKETDAFGGRTHDSVLAEDIHDELIEKGYKVFFSRITLEDKLGSQYEPYIFAALHSSKIMLHVTTDSDHSDSVWVRNEWSRYLNLIRDGQKKTLIPCYKGVTAYDLPEEMQNLQGQDFSKIGAMQDLLRGIGKILPINKNTRIVEAQKSSSKNDEQELFESQLRKGYIYLSKGMWSEAEESFKNAVKLVEKCGRAYVGLLYAQAKEYNIDTLLKNQSYQIEAMKNLDLAQSFADELCLKELDEITQKINKKIEKDNEQYFKELLKNEDWSRAEECLKKSDTNKEKYITLYNNAIIKTIKQNLENVISINDLHKLDDCFKILSKISQHEEFNTLTKLLNDKRTKVIETYENSFISKLNVPFDNNPTISSLKSIVFKVLDNRKAVSTFKSYTNLVEIRSKEIEDSALKYLQNNVLNLIACADTVSECASLQHSLKGLKRDEFFKDIYDSIQQRIDYINDKNKQIKRAKAIKKLKISGIVSAALAIIIGVSIGVKAIIDEANRSNTYNNAIVSMENGLYDEAINYFSSLQSYKDSESKINVCNGLKALSSTIPNGSENDIKNGIYKIIDGNENVEVKYIDEDGKSIKRLKNASNENEVVEIADSKSYDFYVPSSNDGYSFVKWTSKNVSYKNNQTHLTLKTNWDINVYNIVYHLDGGYNSSVNPNNYTIETDTIVLAVPGKIGYHFLGWYEESSFTNKIESIEKGTFGDIHLYAKWEINSYNIIFKNYDGTELLKTTCYYNDYAVYTGETPIRARTQQYTFTFAGWDKPLGPISMDTVFTATYNNTVNKYTVTFKNYDGTILGYDTVDYGSAAHFNSTPIRQNSSDDLLAYEFIGWDAQITNITDNCERVAQYKTLNRYLATFISEGATLQSSRFNENTVPIYSGSTPIKSATAQYSYTFSGWSPSLNKISSDTTYYAQFSNTTNKYTVTFKNWNGSVLSTSTVNYGSTAAYNGNTPTRTTDNYVYTFDGWDISLSNVTSNRTATAQYDKYTNGLSFEKYATGDSYVVSKYEGTHSDLVLPKKYLNLPVTRVMSYNGTNFNIFAGNESVIKTITLGENIEEVCKNAFCGLNDLIELNLNSKLVSIGEGAFSMSNSQSSKLDYIFIPKSVQYIKENAFWEYTPTSHVKLFLCEASQAPSGASSCSNGTGKIILNANKNIKTDSNFTYIVINGKATLLKYIGNSNDLIVPKTIGGYQIKSIGYAFFNRNCPEYLTLNCDIDEILISAFESTGLSKLIINGSIPFINRYAFRYCNSFTELLINNNCTSLDSSALDSCYVKRIKLPFLDKRIQSIYGGGDDYYYPSIDYVEISGGNIDQHYFGGVNIDTILLKRSVNLTGEKIFATTTYKYTTPRLLMFESENFDTSWNQNAFNLGSSSNFLKNSSIVYGYKETINDGAFTFALTEIDNNKESTLIYVDKEKLPYQTYVGRVCDIPSTDSSGNTVTRIKGDALLVKDCVKYVIPETVKYLDDYQVYNTSGYSSIYVYLKTPSVDSTWSSNWNKKEYGGYTGSCYVYVSSQWHYDSSGFPQQI